MEVMINFRFVFTFLLLTCVYFLTSSNATGASFLDDFSTDSTGGYTATDLWTKGGTGRFFYDAAGQRASVQTGDDISLKFSHALPASDSGIFRIDFIPTKKYPSGGWVVVRLIQDESNYYEVWNADGYSAGGIKKIVNGREVDGNNFQDGYTQNNLYTLIISYSPYSTRVEGLGDVSTINSDSSDIVVTEFEVEVGQQDAFFDNIYHDTNTDPVLPSIITHPADQSVTPGQAATFSVVAAGTTPLVYQWRKDGVEISGATGSTFTTPAATTDDDGTVFDCVVTNGVGSVLSNVATLSIMDNFSDDFSTDSTGGYTVTDVWTQGGTGRFFYDAAGQRASAQTGNDISLKFSRSLPASDSGTFRIDFIPTTKYPLGGWVVVRLIQDESNYYEVWNEDGYSAGGIKKIVNGQEVDGINFQNGYTQKYHYNITISYSPDLTRAEAFGEILNIDGDSSGIVVNEFEVEVGQQDAYFDNVYYGSVSFADYYVALGDSITLGGDDDIFVDGKGYEPVLIDLLTSLPGYPNIVANEGKSGEDSSEALDRMQNVIDRHLGGQHFLILYGTNDSHGSLPIPSGMGLSMGDSGYAGTYKDNMQQIVDAVYGAGKQPVLAKVPITLGPCSTCAPFPDPAVAKRNLLIQEYNQVIQELVTSNGIEIAPPDFYGYFSANLDQFYDNLHPNGIGYQQMAHLWFNVLTAE